MLTADDILCNNRGVLPMTVPYRPRLSPSFLLMIVAAWCAPLSAADAPPPLPGQAGEVTSAPAPAPAPAAAPAPAPTIKDAAMASGFLRFVDNGAAGGRLESADVTYRNADGVTV